MPTNFNTAYTPEGTKDRSGKIVGIRRVNADGSSISGENWFNFPAKEASAVQWERPLTEFADEAGDIIASEDGNVKTEIKVTVMQSDSNTMNFLLTQTINTYYAFIMHTGAGLPGTCQYVYFPCTRPSVGINVKYPKPRPEVTFKPQDMTSSWNGNSLSVGDTANWNA